MVSRNEASRCRRGYRVPAFSTFLDLLGDNLQYLLIRNPQLPAKHQGKWHDVKGGVRVESGRGMRHIEQAFRTFLLKQILPILRLAGPLPIFLPDVVEELLGFPISFRLPTLFYRQTNINDIGKP